MKGGKDFKDDPMGLQKKATDAPSFQKENQKPDETEYGSSEYESEEDEREDSKEVLEMKKQEIAQRMGLALRQTVTVPAT